MNQTRFFPAANPGDNFLPPEYIPAGKDEYWYRNCETSLDLDSLRPLSAAEIASLEANGNVAVSWDSILVSEPFESDLVRNSSFSGLVRIGPLARGVLRYHDFSAPVGIINSSIISCDIGAYCSIRDVNYLSHYLIGDEVILSRIDEMQCSNHAKFGNGVLTPGEEEEVRVGIDVMNEAGGRTILPFEDMTTADAFLWAAWRDDRELVMRLNDITQREYGTLRGRYGAVGAQSVIKSCNIIKDCRIGSCAYIKGANKLKNLSILSSGEEPTQIGEGVELVNGIVGYACHIFYGSKGVRFVLGRNSSLKYGARLIHSVLGDNSTVSCCEMLNNLVFPAHEQHHNNSFLIASLVAGLSNMAAGATVGSNHNSRAPDGELRAKRGFWPGLSVTLKHPSRFASYTLISKGNYPNELDVPLPFSLLSLEPREGKVELMGAYFWMHNLYALERNAWKARARDKRVNPVQIIHSDYLLPDTVEEIMAGMERLARWVGEALAENDSNPGGEAALQSGLSILSAARDPFGAEGSHAALSIEAGEIDRGKGRCIILKPWQSWHAYREMLEHYCGKTLSNWLSRPGAATVSEELDYLKNSADGQRVDEWVNMGGQIMAAWRVDALREEIRNVSLDSWADIHATYARIEESFPEDCARHALAVLAWLENLAPRLTQSPAHSSVATPDVSRPSTLTLGSLRRVLVRSADIARRIALEVRACRERDLADPFRAITYRNSEEQVAVLGTVDDNSFIALAAREAAAYGERISALCKMMGDS